MRLLLDRYGGDLRCLREAQGIWDELRPFVDDRAAGTARDLGLPSDAEALTDLVSEDDLPRLVTALVRVALADDTERVRARASGDDTQPSEAEPARASKSELYERARDADIERRSKMNKAELTDAQHSAEDEDR